MHADADVDDAPLPSVGARSVPDSLELFLASLPRRARLTRDQERDLTTRAQAGDRHAKEKMLLVNVPLVISIAKRVRGRGVPFLDLIQEGTFGLNRAIEKFDWRLGYRFSTYASPWIEQACQRALWDQGQTIRRPTNVGELGIALRLADRYLTTELRREPTVAELADATGAKVADIEHFRRMNEPLRPLDQTTGIDGTPRREFAVAADFSDDVLERVDQSRKARVIRDAVEALPVLERRVVELRFAFDGGSCRSAEDTGARLGLDRSRVRRLEQAALDRIERHLAHTSEFGDVDAQPFR